MELFKAHELMAVVIGNENYDWNALEQNAQYKDGYSSGDQTVNYNTSIFPQIMTNGKLYADISYFQIQWFWEVFHELSLEDKKKFLLFLTGSDRIPIEGMKAIKVFTHLYVIQYQKLRFFSFRTLRFLFNPQPMISFYQLLILVSIYWIYHDIEQKRN